MKCSVTEDLLITRNEFLVIKVFRLQRKTLLLFFGFFFPIIIIIIIIIIFFFFFFLLENSKTPGRILMKFSGMVGIDRK